MTPLRVAMLNAFIARGHWRFGASRIASAPLAQPAQFVFPDLRGLCRVVAGIIILAQAFEQQHFYEEAS